jgi:hypothetical protein
MDPKTFLVALPGIVWIVTEIVGKFVFPKLSKDVLAVIVSVLSVAAAQMSGAVPMGILETCFGAAYAGPVAGLLHDKAVEKLLVLGKTELAEKK